MKKKILSLLIIPLCMFGMINVVKAACGTSQDSNKYKITVDEGEKYCATVNDAFKEVADKGTVTLIATDNTISSRAVIDVNKTVTFDLNGNNINANVSKDMVIKFQHIRVTITDSKGNGKIVNTSGGGIMIVDNGTLTLEKGTVEVNGELGALQVGSVAPSTGNLIVKGGVVKSTNATAGAAIVVVYGNATIKDGEIASQATGGTGATIQTGSKEDKATDNVSVVIEGGTITNIGANQGPAILAVRGTTTIKGGTVTNYASTSPTIQVGLVKDLKANVNITGGTIENKSETDSTAIVVFFGGSEATINGGTVKVNEGSDNSLAVVVGSNETDSGEKAKVTIKNGNIYGGVALFGQKPQLDITGGNITSSSFAISGNGSKEGKNATIDSVINISGGSITSTGTAAIYHPQKGTLKISGGKITGQLGIVARSGKINISENAIITANSKTNETFVVGDAKDAEGKVELPGGIGVIVDNTENYPGGKSNVEITGGEFITNGDAVLAYKDKNGEEAGAATSVIKVSGGKFNNNVPEKYIEEDYSKSAGGVVGTVYTIEKETPIHGEFTVNENAAAGETVTITVRPNSGYRVSSIRVMNGEQEVDVTGYYSFTMPAGNVKISVTFVRVETSSSESNKIVVEESSEDVTLSESSMENLKEILENTTDEELKALLGKENITILLENKEITKESLTEEEVTKFENVLEDGTIAEYLDLNIIVKASGHTDHYLKELSSLITIEVKLPELPAVKEGYSRKYYILREHDGVVEKLDATLSEDGKSLTFASDKFSKYAIAYVDEEVHDEVVDKNPSTVDNIMSYVALTIASIGLLGVSSKKIIKK